ncbi:MAG: LEA type 2 family protein [Luteimonas sp.]
MAANIRKHLRKFRNAAVVGAACAALLAACSSGPVRRVSQPAASIQQLSVRVDGAWSVDLRIENFSSIPMRFDAVNLAMTIDGETAGTLQSQPALTIGPESADVVTLPLAPASTARIAIADALADRRGMSYTLNGTVDATPDKSRQRHFDLKRSSTLNPVPGLPGVLR